MKKILVVIGIVVLFVGATTIPTVMSLDIQKTPVPTMRKIWYVDDDATCPGNGTWVAPYCRIQLAIDNAGVGDGIEVANGTYYENIVINQELTLDWYENDIIGNDTGMPVIDGGGVGNVIGLTESASRVTITGFIIQNSGPLNGAGIYGQYPEAVNIEGNVIINNARGIHFYTIKTSNINGNIVSNNNWGIHLNGAILCTVQNNWIIDNSHCGIALEDSVSINVRENEIRDNRLWAGILLYRSYDFGITQNNFIDNGKNGTTHSFVVNCHTFMGFASNYYHPRRVSFNWYVHVGFIHIKRIPDLQLPFIFHIDFSAEDELLKIPNPVPNYPII